MAHTGFDFPLFDTKRDPVVVLNGLINAMDLRGKGICHDADLPVRGGLVARAADVDVVDVAAGAV